MESLSYKHWWLMALKGILAIIFGLIALYMPQEVIMSLVIFFGIMALASGLFLTIGAMMVRNANRHWGWWLLEGLVDILFGLVIIAHPLATAWVFVLLIGLYALVTGFMQLARAFLKRPYFRYWWLLLLNGLLSVLIGLLLLFNPFEGTILVGYFIGVYALLLGIFLLMTSFALRRSGMA